MSELVLTDHTTLASIAQTKGHSFYQGDLAEKIIQQSKNEGGYLSDEDLATHQSCWVEPIHYHYRDVYIVEMPPNNGGITVLIALAILNELNIADYAVDSVESAHLQIEAMKLALQESEEHLADPRFMKITTDELLSPAHIAPLAKKISLNSVIKPKSGLPQRFGTVYATTADQSGMMVSLIQSHYYFFCSGVVINGTGIGMQNRGLCFNLQKGHPNVVGSKKYPYHTIMPAFFMYKGQPLMTLGAIGGMPSRKRNYRFHRESLTISRILKLPWMLLVGIFLLNINYI